ncbi:unnamed protein product [Acanthoscelides obtectus]|uniref:Uncharacterized protein n=1 Tax=Acanthoscelides obtectus TaxID=200917 RepID=A0A9P0NZY3_ACAOB|nr:unnamed protein product [Acanthoscelides obtectus]CAK1665902.1 hypothetical protein AOBTE_LOCUS25035 [Acanthoscelides obtectus]
MQVCVKQFFKTSSTAGKINFSPIVCGFPDFAISNEKIQQLYIKNIF